MYWEESNNGQEHIVPDDVVDLVFGISCRCLPVDHAWELSQAIQAALPWFADEVDAGIHSIHVAESANGWIRPDAPDALLHPSRRTKLSLRVPRHRIQDAMALTGSELYIGEHALTINKASERPLSDITTVFARYVASNEVTDGATSEQLFMEAMIERLHTLNVRPKKMLCGIEKRIRTPEGDLSTRSIMLADLDFSESITLQQKGLGEHRQLGCGLFLPHKDINVISEDQG